MQELKLDTYGNLKRSVKFDQDLRKLIDDYYEDFKQNPYYKIIEKPDESFKNTVVALIANLFYVKNLPFEKFTDSYNSMKDMPKVIPE